MFADSESADRAIRELNGTEVDGRKIFLRKVWRAFMQFSLPPFLPPLSILPSSALSTPFSLPPSPSSLSCCCCSALAIGRVFSQSLSELFFYLENIKSSFEPPSPPTSSGPLTGHASRGQRESGIGCFPPQAPPPSQSCLDCLHSQCKPHPSIVAHALASSHH